MRTFELLALCLFTAAASHAADRKLIWSDEFDKPGAPDAAKWTYEEGFVRNQESQYYMRDRRENVRIEDGKLIIEARKERMPNPRYQAGSTRWQTQREHLEYTSGSLTTRGIAEWKYGRIEARAKLPGGRGTWPAIWMLGQNCRQTGWPKCGEIDIMEQVGYDPGVIHANVHTEAYNHVKKTNKGAKINIPDDVSAFHVYAMEWTPTQMDFFVDDKKYFTYVNDKAGEASWPFDQPFYLILNVAVGGGWGGTKGIDDTIFPRRMEVDYVRVYAPLQEQQGGSSSDTAAWRAAPASEWRQLFDGKSLNGWTPKIAGRELGDNWLDTFRAENGVLKVSYDKYTNFVKEFGHLFYKEPFSHYVLRVEYRFVGNQAPGGPGWATRNSGAMLHCPDPKTMGRDQDFPISIEAQFLGGLGKGPRSTANLCTPGTNVVIDGKLWTTHCLSSKSKTYDGDQWVTAEFEVLGSGRVRHIVEGQTVLEYEKPQFGGGNVINFDTSVKRDGELIESGYISLQAESHPVEFRKVELLDLVGCTDKKSPKFRPYFTKHDSARCK